MINLPKKLGIDICNLRVDFGKYKGERWTRVPVSYLRWVINEGTFQDFVREICEKELARRGCDQHLEAIELASHAIDRASIKLYDEWRTYPKGLHSWLVRESARALREGIVLSEDKYLYNNKIFILKKGVLYHTLVTVYYEGHNE
jgi:hypothetical protein